MHKNQATHANDYLLPLAGPNALLLFIYGRSVEGKVWSCLFVCHARKRSRLEWTPFTAWGALSGRRDTGQVQKLNDESATCRYSRAWLELTLATQNDFAQEQTKAFATCLVLCSCKWKLSLHDWGKWNRWNSVNFRDQIILCQFFPKELKI